MMSKSWGMRAGSRDQVARRTRFGTRIVGSAGFAIALVSSAFAQSERKVPGLLFGGGAAVAPLVVEVDPRLPRGPSLDFPVRPTPTSSRCSATRAVCVHVVGTPTVATAAQMQRALGWMEQANDWLFLALGLPPPLADVLGASPAADLYLLADASGSDGLRVVSDFASVASDVSRGYCTLGVTAVTEFEVTTCLGELSLLGLDAAEGAGLRRGLASYLSSLVTLPGSPLLSALDDTQANPQVNVLSRDLDALSAAGALFWSYLDSTWSPRAHGTLPTAVFSMSRQRTNDARLDWNNEPDVLDVVRRALNNEASAVADFLGGYAVSKFFLGARDDGAHLPGLAWLGDLGRSRADWVVEFASLPRNLKSPRALEPYGMSYVWLDLGGVPLGTELSFRIDWEAPVAFKWLVISLDPEGREVSRWDLPYLERETRIEKTLLNFETAAALVFVGVNLGAVDLLHPFDPDQQPWEPHAYTLYLADTTDKP
jgi:hypothetical protein